MGKVIVVTSGKGGVGKTTSTAVIDGLPFAVTHPVGYRSPLRRHSNASLVGAEISPGKSFARPETAAAFLATPADFGRQRPR
jgi:hypothetical protein